MRYTWGEIQIMAIEKMFLNNVKLLVSDLPTLREDKKFKTYLAAMPNLANEGLIRLMSVGRPVRKKYVLDITTPQNIASRQERKVYTQLKDDLAVSALNTHSIYFEVNDDCVVTIELYNGTTWDLLETITHTQGDTKEYVVYKRLITNENDQIVRVTFKADGYMYNVRNIALYDIKFREEEDVIENVSKKRYKLSELIPDFYDIDTIEYTRNVGEVSKYDSNFDLEGDDTLIIDSKLQGNFTITYKAYPDKITDETEDDYIFNLSPEMVVLLPSYIVSQAYKEDDIAIATQYRNEFEVSLQELRNINEPMDFADTSGWL